MYVCMWMVVIVVVSGGGGGVGVVGRVELPIHIDVTTRREAAVAEAAAPQEISRIDTAAGQILPRPCGR